MVTSINLHLPRRVAVVIEEPVLRLLMETAISAEGKGSVSMAQAGDPVDFEVALSADGQQFELRDAAGGAIPGLRPPLLVSEPDGVTQVVRRLIHLAKYAAVKELTAAETATSPRMKVELPGRRVRAGGTTFFRPGDTIALHITNLLRPNPAAPSDLAQILNVTVLDLGPDWSIQQIFPPEAGACEPLQPGATIPLEFEAYLPEGVSASTDILKVFGARATTQFRWLELPALDQPDPHGAAARSAISDPLERNLAMITGEMAPPAAIELTGTHGHDEWTVAQAEVRVECAAIHESALERRMRPGADSRMGFLGHGEVLEEVIAQDAETLDNLGISYEQLAAAIEDVLTAAMKAPHYLVKGNSERYLDLTAPSKMPRFDLYHLPPLSEGFLLGDLQVFTVLWRGWQNCPWECPVSAEWSDRDFLIINRRTGAYFTGPALIVHLIREHRFFEGLYSPYRVDPARAAHVLDLA
jgi:hypothetical protein